MAEKKSRAQPKPEPKCAYLAIGVLSSSGDIVAGESSPTPIAALNELVAEYGGPFKTSFVIKLDPSAFPEGLPCYSISIFHSTQSTL